jgi:hypothetical protein
MAMVTCFLDPETTFLPARRLVVNITNSNPMHIATYNDHGYITGQTVRLYIGSACGMPQANKLTGEIAVTSPNTFDVNIDSTFFDGWVLPLAPTASDDICTYVIPIGENTAMLNAAFHNAL